MWLLENFILNEKVCSEESTSGVAKQPSDKEITTRWTLDSINHLSTNW